MRVTQIDILNFRSIRHVVVDLNENDRVRRPEQRRKDRDPRRFSHLPTRRWGQRGTGFTEYDVHLTSDTDDPKSSLASIADSQR